MKKKVVKKEVKPVKKEVKKKEVQKIDTGVLSFSNELIKG